MEMNEYPLYSEMPRDERMRMQKKAYYAVTFIIPDTQPKAGKYVAICRDLDTARRIKATASKIPGVKRVYVTHNSMIQPYKRVITDIESIKTYFNL